VDNIPFLFALDLSILNTPSALMSTRQTTIHHWLAQMGVQEIITFHNTWLKNLLIQSVFYEKIKTTNGSSLVVSGNDFLLGLENQL